MNNQGLLQRTAAAALFFVPGITDLQCFFEIPIDSVGKVNYNRAHKTYKSDM